MSFNSTYFRSQSMKYSEEMEVPCFRPTFELYFQFLVISKQFIIK